MKYILSLSFLLAFGGFSYAEKTDGTPCATAECDKTQTVATKADCDKGHCDKTKAVTAKADCDGCHCDDTKADCETGKCETSKCNEAPCDKTEKEVIHSPAAG